MTTVQKRVLTTFEKRALEIIEITTSHGHDPMVAMEIAVAQVKLEKAHYDLIKATVESRNHEAFFWSRLDVVRRHMTDLLTEEPNLEQDALPDNMTDPSAEELKLNLKQDVLPYDLQAMVVKRKASSNTAKVATEEIEAIRKRGRHHDSTPIPDNVQSVKADSTIARLYMDELEAKQQAAQQRQNRLVKLSRRSLKLRLQQQRQFSAQKRQLEQQADKQPPKKLARQDNASPMVQYDGPDVECEVLLDQDPVATDFGVTENQQNYSAQFVQNNPEKPRTLWSTDEHWNYVKETLFEMQELVEPISNLLHGIVAMTRLNQPPAQLRDRIILLEERNAALEADKCRASFQQIEQLRVIDELRAQLQRETEKTSDLALHKTLTVVLQRKVDELQQQMGQQRQQEADTSTADLFCEADLDQALSSVPGCSNAQRFIDEVVRTDLQDQDRRPTVALFFDCYSLS